MFCAAVIVETVKKSQPLENYDFTSCDNRLIGAGDSVFRLSVVTRKLLA